MCCRSFQLPLCLTLFFTSCYGGTQPVPDDRRTEAANQTGAQSAGREGLLPNDRELIEVVLLAGEGEGNVTAVEKIQSLPREPLIAALTRLRQGLAGDDGLRVKIAYLLCQFGHAYKANRAVLISAASEEGRYKGVDEEDMVVKLDVLIRRGDKGLLKYIFGKAGGADGALGEGITSVFERELADDAEGFVSALKAEQPRVRRDVYGLLEWMRPTEGVRRNLRAVTSSADPATVRVAKDLLAALKEKPGR